MRKLGEGAEAKVFEGEILGVKAVVKVRQPKAYRIKELDEQLRITRTRKEARAMVRAAEAGVGVPLLLALGKFSIYMERIGGRLLKDAEMHATKYKQIGSMLAKMHNAGVVHGDFTPANIIMNGKGLCVIDFGLADINNSVEDRALDLLLMKRSVGSREYRELESAYSGECANSKSVFTRLAEIERRGRYQIRTLA